METIVNKRVKMILDAKGYSKTSYGESLKGMSASKFVRQMSGENAMTIDVINAILRDFPDVSAEWLFRGSGTMFISDDMNKIVDDLQSIITDRDREIAHLNEMLDDKRTIIKEREEKIEGLKALLHSSHEDYIKEKRKIGA